VVVDHGRVVVEGTPDELKGAIGSRLDVVLRDAAQLTDAAHALDALGEVTTERDERRISVPVNGSVELTAVVRELDRAGVAVVDVALRQPTLDEVFLAVTR
jgi:ABC-2 type transport system ATP-binding protein